MTLRQLNTTFHRWHDRLREPWRSGWILAFMAALLVGALVVDVYCDTLWGIFGAIGVLIVLLISRNAYLRP